MSIDMYVSASQNQAESVSKMSRQQVQGYEQLQKAINDFALNSPFLTGKAYDSSKVFFYTVLAPLAQGGILLSETVEQAVKRFPEEYISQVDSGDLKQADLEEKIRQANRLIAQAEDIRQMILSSNTPDKMKPFHLTSNLVMIEIYYDVKRKLERKLQQFMDFHGNSPKIFSEIASLQQAIDQGLAQTKTAWNGTTGTFTIPSKKDLAWRKTIEASWQTRAEKIRKEPLPKTKAEILRDYSYSSNSNSWVNKKTGEVSSEVGFLYGEFARAEVAPQENPQLAFFNEMLRTGKHPITGLDITGAERVNAKMMISYLVLQPFVGVWAMSKVPQVYDNKNVSKVKKASGAGTGNGANSPKNVSLHEKYKDVLTTTEKANPLVDSLKETGKLPDNFISKEAAELAGWKPGKAIENYTPGSQLGGDVFKNNPPILPENSGRIWYEADVGLSSSMSRAKQPGTRLVYSNDGLMYITTDHYETVHLIGNYLK